LARKKERKKGKKKAGRYRKNQGLRIERPRDENSREYLRDLFQKTAEEGGIGRKKKKIKDFRIEKF